MQSSIDNETRIREIIARFRLEPHPEGGAFGEVYAAPFAVRDAAGERPLAVIPAGTVFAAENLDPQGYTFISCATTPRFRYEGFELFSKKRLLEMYGRNGAASGKLLETIERLAMP